MSGLLRILFQLSWGLGLLSLLAAVVVKIMALESHARITGHTLVLAAGTLFLCALATREVASAKSR